MRTLCKVFVAILLAVFSTPVATSEVSRLPAGGPPALYVSQPAPMSPRGWTYPEAFPVVSGATRLARGAAFWSGFLYDDHGAQGHLVESSIIGLSPAVGTFVYPDGPARDNGSDIAAAAVGLDGESVTLRVDWQTLADPMIPVALWGFDTDDNIDTGTQAWPAGAGVRAPGTDMWLLVSSRGAWLLGGSAKPQLFVDTEADSFVVRLARGALPIHTRWKARLVAGLANATGDGFAPVGFERGSLPGQPPVYDVGFRSHDQEPVAGNWWREAEQAVALASGDVGPFALTIDWAALQKRTTTTEPEIRGWTNAWYRSSIELGDGIAPPTRGYAADFAPNFLGRRQPYGLYVPEAEGGPLTILLHSINVQHNQFAIWNPQFIEDVCGGRRSLCIAPFGRGADGWWAAEAELDMWEVWNRVAGRYPLDPSGTVLAGYSMGGYGVYRLGLENPDVFASAVVLAGAPACSIRVVEGAEQSVASGIRACDYESDTTPLLGNAGSVPFYIGHDGLDELAPATSAIQLASRFDEFGFRHRFELYPNQDHVAWSMAGRFEGASTWLKRSNPQIALDPAMISYTWYAEHQRPDLGTGPDGVWWLSGLRASSSDPGFRAHIDAESKALPPGARDIKRSSEGVLNGDGLAAATELTWEPKVASFDPKPEINLILSGVAAVTVDVSHAGVSKGLVTVTSDGPALIRLTELKPGTRVRTGDGAFYKIRRSWTIQHKIGAGTTVFFIE